MLEMPPAQLELSCRLETPTAARAHVSSRMLCDAQARKAQAQRMAADALGDEDQELMEAGAATPGGYRGRRQRAERAQQTAAQGPSGARQSDSAASTVSD